MNALLATATASFWRTAFVVVALSALAIAAGIALRLSVPGAFGLYFVVWWTLLFAILPLRVTTQAEAGEVVAGSEPGAPVAPALREKAVLTTVTAGMVFVVVAIVFPLAGL